MYKESFTTCGKNSFFGIEIAISNSKIICENLLHYKKDLFSSIIDEIGIFDEIEDNSNISNYIPFPFRNRIHDQTIGKIGECSFCRIIYKLRKKTIYYCQKCKKHLHPECFGSYHSLYVYNLKK